MRAVVEGQCHSAALAGETPEDATEHGTVPVIRSVCEETGAERTGERTDGPDHRTSCVVPSTVAYTSRIRSVTFGHE